MSVYVVVLEAGTRVWSIHALGVSCLWSVRYWPQPCCCTSLSYTVPTHTPDPDTGRGVAVSGGCVRPRWVCRSLVTVGVPAAVGVAVSDQDQKETGEPSR